MSYSQQTIPASSIVDVLPGVLAAGQTGISLNEVMLTTNTRVPIGTVLSFPSAAAVSTFFGPTSTEATEADVYFNGYNLRTSAPSALLFAQYPTGDVGAYLRGGNISTLSLTALQAITGVLTITIDGTPHTSSSINLSGATSFSNAAQTITNALGVTGPTQASATGSFGATFTASGSGTTFTVTAVTGTIHPGTVASAAISGTGVPAGTYIVSQQSGTSGGAGTYTTSAATTSSGASITCSSSTLDVSAVASGTLAVGQEITGVGVTSGTYITALGSGTTGGAGTYVTTTTQQVASETLTAVMPTVTYDSVSGAFVVVSGTTGASSTIGFASGTAAAPLLLTQATGAVTSQGAIAATPSAFMTALTAITIDWASFQCIFDPDNGSGNANKLLFAQWTNSTNNQFAYLATDTDITPTESTDAASSLGQLLKASNLSGTSPQYQPVGGSNHLSAFVGGYIASVDFNATNGRATAAFKSQSGITPSVTDGTVQANLIANGYNFYGSYATAGAAWQFFYPGQISGPFAWLDSYIDQIWLNNQIQVAVMNLLTSVGRVPFNPAGAAMIRATLTAGANGSSVTLPPASPVAAGLNNGVITRNVALSSSQIQAVNTLAGMPIDQILSTQGWYLVIPPATAANRAARTWPGIILLYCDGGAVQKINITSLLVQ